MVRRLIALLVSIASLTAGAYDRLTTVEDSIRSAVDESPDPICGIWQIGGDAGTRFAIVRGKKDFDILMLDSPDMSVKPATICGTLTPTGRKGLYDATLFDKLDRRVKSSRFIIELDSYRSLVFKPYKQKTTVSFNRLIPYFFRFTIRREDTRPDDVDAALRIYPPTVKLPVTL